MAVGTSSTEARAAGRWLYVLGGLLTAAYLAFLAYYGCTRWPKILDMSPNEHGDLLAGAFSPLAFAWLVLGFIQQGIELRQNSAALILQAQELRAAAEHAGAMVEVQKKEFDLRIQELEEARAKAEASRKRAEANAIAAARREEELRVKRVQPRFNFSLAFREADRPRIAKCELVNRGKNCSGVRVVMTPIESILRLEGTTSFPDFQTDLKVDIYFFSATREPRTQPLSIYYVDLDGVERSQEFIVSVTDTLDINPVRE